MARPSPASAVTCPASSVIPAPSSSMLAVTDSARSSCLPARSTAAWAPSTDACARCSSTSLRSRRSATSLLLSDSSRPSRNRTNTPTLTSSAQKTAAISAAASAAFMPRFPLTGPSASWLLLVVPFPQDGPDPPGAFGDAGLLAMPRRLVVDAVRHRVRRVALRDDAVVEVVRVEVALAVADLARPRIVRIAKVRGHCAEQAGPDVGVGRADRLDDRVGLGRQRDMDDCLGQVDPGLRQPDELHRLRGGDGGLQRGGVGHAHVLAGV